MIDESNRSPRRPHPVTAAALAGGIALLAAAGCQTPPSTTSESTPPSTPDSTTAEADGGGTTSPTVASGPWLVVSETPGAGGAVSADELTPFISAVERWLFVEGKLAGTTVNRTFGPTSAHGAEWRADLGDGDIQYWVRRDGGIAMTAVEATRDTALSLFDPPLGVMPASLLPGATYTSTSAMTVTDIDDPTRVQQRGTATRTIEHRGEAEVQTPAGRYTAQVLVMSFHAALNLADARTEATIYVLPRQGPIATDTTQTIKAALIFNRTTTDLMVRADGP